MKLIGKNKKTDIKRVHAPKMQGTFDRLKQYVSPWAILFGLILIIAISTVNILGGQVLPFYEGQRPGKEIRSRVSFQQLDQQATAQARDQAGQSTPNYYKPNKAFLDQLDLDLTMLFTNAKATTQIADLSAEKKKLLSRIWQINEETFPQIRILLDNVTPVQFQAWTKSLRTLLLNETIIEIMPEEYRKAESVILVDDEKGDKKTAGKWVFNTDTDKIKDVINRATVVFPTGLQSIIKKYLRDNLKPVWLFDQNQTDKMRLIRFTSDANKVYHKFTVGSVLVDQNNTLDKQDIEILALEHHAYWKSIDPRRKLLSDTGVTLLSAVIIIALWAYAYKFQRRAVHNWTRSAAIALTLFLMIILAKFLDLAGMNPFFNVCEIVLLSMIVTIAYEHRFAMMVMACTVTLLVITISGSSISLMFTLLAAGITVILTLEEIRSRSKLIEISSASALMAFAVVWASQLAEYQDFKPTLINAIYAAGGAFIAGFIVQGILPLIERTFQIATSMTLLEWCDASKPLLKRLVLEAPGTFSHSLLIGSLSETASDAIGASGLLARVGSYYHDIGKISKAKYFVENQPGNVITHHKGLTPAMSLLVIIGHVKDGLELAKEYGLPKILHNFISEHHGTTRVEYFYNLASQKNPETDKETLNVTFRYPGPKPRSKEVAIVMLADGVEGTTRSLAEPTAGRIEAIVHQIIKKRLEDGQLDECDLTMRELHVIEESLTKSLCSLYHSRIAYPSQAASQTPPQPTETTTKIASGL